ncbi:MAG: G8 domain-containing protein [Pseudomonadota bacterium]
MSEGNDMMHGDHMAVMALLDPSDATHRAVSDGDWSDPATWEGGKVPGAGADVFIPAGVAVRYDVASDAELGFVRVDGELNWATTRDTKMVVDTIIGTASSKITVGTLSDPVRSNVEAEIVFADGAIDRSIDPTMVSRGLITMGELDIQGGHKLMCEQLAVEARAGDTSLKVKNGDHNWQVGDEIVIIGVANNGKNAQGQLITQDETRTISKIDPDGTVHFDQPLIYDHTTPSQYDIPTFVGNATRNVSFTSENPDGVRGHVMVMETGADIRNAEFRDLGRTDVSEERGTDDNPIGRYPLHLHKTGTDSTEDWSEIVGNAVVGSPGWGIVQHESFAAVDWNFVTDIQGAGIVSESGNEPGQWVGNLVSNVYGDGEPLDHVRDELYGDFGHAGVAYESQSRLIVQQENIAAGSQWGWAWRATEEFKTDPSLEEVTVDRDNLLFDPDPLGGFVVNEEAQIMGFTGNIAMGVGIGIDTGHRVGITQETDLHSQIFDFTALNVDQGIRIFNYTGNYVIKDSLFVNGFEAIILPSKHEGTNIIDSEIANFDRGIVNSGFNRTGVIVDLEFNNVGEEVRVVGKGTDLDFVDRSQITDLDAPILKLDPGSDLTLDRWNGKELFIAGTITDSAGSYGFATNEWVDQPASVSDGLWVTFGQNKWLEFEEAFELYGTMREDGGWIMPVVFWISDRVTGEPHPVMVPIELVGFTDAELRPYEITNFSLPSQRAVTAPDTRIAVAEPDTPPSDNQGGGSQDDDGGQTGGSGQGSDEGSGDDGQSGGDSGEIPIGEIPIGGGGSQGQDSGDARVLYSIDGPKEFNDKDNSIVVHRHEPEFEVSSGVISFTFEADKVSGANGLFSKDAHGYKGGGNHISAWLQSGQLIVRFQDDNSERVMVAEDIVANQAYDVLMTFGDAGVGLWLDGTQIEYDANFEVDWRENKQPIQVGGLGWSSADGADDAGWAFDGTISDFTIATSPDALPPADEGEKGYAYTGTKIFDGSQGKVLNIAPSDALEIPEGTISLSFTAYNINNLSGLFSKDASGFAGGGNHVAAWIDGGTLFVRLQNGSSERIFSTDGIIANIEYDLEVIFGPDGVGVLLDGNSIGMDESFIMSWEDNQEYLQVGALGWSSSTGGSGYANPFIGEITDFEVSPVAGNLDGTPPPPPPEPEPELPRDVFALPGTQSFNRLDSSVVNQEHIEELEIENAVISLTFNADRVNGTYGLFSKDASGFEGGGNHVAAWIRNGELKVRFQDEISSVTYTAGGIRADRDYELEVGFGDAGIGVMLNGEVVGRDEDFEVTWENNTEYLQVGALGWSSQAGEGDFKSVFDGDIIDFTVTELPDDAFV